MSAGSCGVGAGLCSGAAEVLGPEALGIECEAAGVGAGAGVISGEESTKSMGVMSGEVGAGAERV